MRRVLRAVVLAAVGAVLVVGCGDKSSSMGTVSGEVTVDGKPLEEGNITFTAPNGKIYSGKIQGGKYTDVKTEPGSNKVQLYERRPGPKKMSYSGPGGSLQETVEEGLPEKYNAKSDLTLDVQPGPNTKDWQTQGLPRKKK